MPFVLVFILIMMGFSGAQMLANRWDAAMGWSAMGNITNMTFPNTNMFPKSNARYEPPGPGLNVKDRLCKWKDSHHKDKPTLHLFGGKYFCHPWSNGWDITLTYHNISTNLRKPVFVISYYHCKKYPSRLLNEIVTDMKYLYNNQQKEMKYSWHS